jgi:hypothetical protein
LITVQPASHGWSTIEAPDGARLHLDWAQQPLPRGFDEPKEPTLEFWLGMWLNYGGWSGDDGPPLQTLTLSPRIGMSETLEESIANRTALLLTRGTKVQWHLTVKPTAP